MTREQLRDELAMLMGGRVAEEIVAGDITTGAQNDIERATKVARQMVTEYGMSRRDRSPYARAEAGRGVPRPRLGIHARLFRRGGSSRSTPRSGCSIDEAHDVALEILTQNRDNLEQLAELLMEKETLDREEVETFFRRVPKWMPREPEVRSAGLAVSRKAWRPSPGKGPAARSASPANRS